MNLRLIPLVLALFSMPCCLLASPNKLRALYNSLDPQSIAEHLAYYRLYPDSNEGEKALQDAWNLLTVHRPKEQQDQSDSLSFYPTDPKQLSASLEGVIGLVNKRQDELLKPLDEAHLAFIDHLASSLSNRSLKGHGARSESEVLALDLEQIDLARSLFLSQFGSEQMPLVRSYEAMVDVMALQILARLPATASAALKIEKINEFIFGEMGFRFPPHSSYAEEIDLYSFLPSVLDSRRGVCLGVSVLYLCIAQRLNLPLEAVTPPGHIYVRYRDPENRITNIETTVRGVHIPCEEYLGIECRSLQQRSLREVIGLTFCNQASLYWKQGQYEKALETYQKALKYMPNDPLVLEFMAYNSLFIENWDEGTKLLKQVSNVVSEHMVSRDTMAEDYLNGKVDAEGIKAVFMEVDETRESILKKKEGLEATLRHYPQFRAGLFSLAVTWLQLHRKGEALEVLEQYHQLEAADPTAEYYLTILYASRLDYSKAWNHFHALEGIVRENHPKLLKSVRRTLQAKFPDSNLLKN